MTILCWTAVYDRFPERDPYYVRIIVALDLDHGTRRPDGGGLDIPGCRRDDAGPAPARAPAAVAGGFTIPAGTTGRKRFSVRALRGLR